MKTYGEFTGYAYDIRHISTMMGHIEEVTGCTVDEYHASIEIEPLVNVTAPKWEFVAIGLKAEPTNVHLPCLARNTESDEWMWSRDLIWFEDAKGFCWNGGNYRDEQSAREQFEKHIDGLIWTARDY